MKLVAVALLTFGMLCNAALATAEGPVSFKALMQSAGAQPSLPPMTDAKDQSTAAATQPAHPPRMTTGGKIMTGTGIGMLAIGGLVVIGTALLDWGPATAKVDAGFATGGALLAGGATLFVFGYHRRSAQ
jgi:hypothetical protein